MFAEPLLSRTPYSLLSPSLSLGVDLQPSMSYMAASSWIQIAAAVISAPLLAYLIMGIFGKNQFPVDGRTVVITGGSQGMGRGLASLLARKGANVVIVARDVKKLEDAIKYIAARAVNPSTQRFHFISADVTSPAENYRIIAEVTAWNNGKPPDIVWANAGMSVPGLFLETSIDSFRAQMDINYWAAVYLAQATLRAWLAPSGAPAAVGTSAPLPRFFLTTSSVAAFCGVAGYTPYSPAKAALRSLHDTLRSELNLYNAGAKAGTAAQPEIRLAAVFPGTILTPGYSAENATKHPVTKVLEEGDPAQTEDEVARVAVRELEKGRRIVTTQMLGAAMRAGALGGSVRDRPIVDTLFGWAVDLAYLFVAPDMENKVSKWAKGNGVPAVKAEGV